MFFDETKRAAPARAALLVYISMNGCQVGFDSEELNYIIGP
jgi:prophage maintenance system killer protein